MTADVHYLNDGEFVGEVHIGNATVSGSMGGHAIIACHHNFLCRCTLFLYIWVC